MAVIFTRRLAATQFDVAGGHTVFGVPADQVTILRDIVVGSTATAAQDITVFMVSTGFTIPLGFFPAVPANGGAHLELRQQLLPSESVTIFLPTGGGSIALTGYVFLS